MCLTINIFLFENRLVVNVLGAFTPFHAQPQLYRKVSAQDLTILRDPMTIRFFVLLLPEAPQF